MIHRLNVVSIVNSIKSKFLSWSRVLAEEPEDFGLCVPN